MTTRHLPFPELSAADAAALIPTDAEIGLSGFTAAGAPKAVPRALAARAAQLQLAGTPMRLRLIAGASTGDSVDEALARCDAIAWRTPFQSSKALRDRINNQKSSFVDMHLSHLPQMIEFGFFGTIDWAIVEATDVTPDGRVYLTTSSGVTPSLLRHADRVIIELNARPSPRLAEMHDVAILPRPPHRSPIPILDPLDRIGVPFCVTDPKKIVGVVRTDEPDGLAAFDEPDAASKAIAGHVAAFLADELAAGRLPPEFLPLQAGVGNLSNAVMAAIGRDDRIPAFTMFTEVLQDSQIDLLRSGRLRGASTCAIACSDPALQRLFSEMDFFAPRVVIRPQELSNNPGVVRRLGVIAINTVLEFDIYGHANSTHVCGTQLMNGIGGSGDFVRNAALSILMAPSTAKAGAISTVVPMVSHCDHTEHSVQVYVTEQGLADIRGLGPMQRARLIIDRCAHPAYRPYLHRYIESARMGHIRHDLARAFDLHSALLQTGTMRSAADK